MNVARRLAAALACAAFAFGTSVSAADAPQKIKITVPSYEVADGAYYIALQKGYFAAEGLDVELEFAGGGTATPALLSGSVDGGSRYLQAFKAQSLAIVTKNNPAEQMNARSGDYDEFIRGRTSERSINALASLKRTVAPTALFIEP